MEPQTSVTGWGDEDDKYNPSLRMGATSYGVTDYPSSIIDAENPVTKSSVAKASAVTLSPSRSPTPTTLSAAAAAAASNSSSSPPYHDKYVSSSTNGSSAASITTSISSASGSSFTSPSQSLSHHPPPKATSSSVPPATNTNASSHLFRSTSQVNPTPVLTAAQSSPGNITQVATSTVLCNSTMCCRVYLGHCIHAPWP